MKWALSCLLYTSVLADNGITDAQIAKTGDNDTQVQIRISDKENTDDLRAALESTLGEKYAGMEYVDISRVGAIAGRDLINNAIKSVSLAAVLMLIYIAIRFDFSSGLAAIIGLLHDVAIMLSAVAVSYTHLDVYKRQQFRSRAGWRCRAKASCGYPN